MQQEQGLSGGNSAGAVFRAGDTVRKPWTPASPHVHAYVASLREAGVEAPAPLGRDEQGRQVWEFIPGTLAAEGLTRPELHRVGAMVRAIHDASAGFAVPADAVWDSAIPAPGAELVCHNDLAPWNLVTGDRWVFIDWDAAAPSTRLWDLAYAAQAFTLNDPSRSPDGAAADLAAFADGYGADAALRAALPAAMAARAEAMHELLRSSHAAGREPWGSMFLSGHGEHWLAASRYVREHAGAWAEALGA
ncbi:phosphotransferase [Microbacterium binotii]|uniref:Aminoglycoside phosphotransferase domain-containing protein n=1 Tax=Microbacterium binotii TaxID=462710 RepID=A0ABP6BP55_9MICO